MMTLLNPNRQARIKWQCRRGMKELDLILEPFAEKMLNQMTEEQVTCFEKLLTQDDPDLYQWLMEKSSPINSEFLALVQFINTHHQLR